MTIDVTHFMYSNNLWEGTIALPTPKTIWLKGGADLFDDVRNIQCLELLARGIEVHINAAISYAMMSEYASDIADTNGLVLDSIYVDAWDDLRMWFSQASKNGRMVGVRLVREKPVSVFCDN